MSAERPGAQGYFKVQINGLINKMGRYYAWVVSINVCGPLQVLPKPACTEMRPLVQSAATWDVRTDKMIGGLRISRHVGSFLAWNVAMAVASDMITSGDEEVTNTRIVCI